MNEQRQPRPQPRKIRGTAIFHDDNSLEFVPQGEGEPVQRSVKKRGESRFYETEGEKQSSYIAHLKVPKDSQDPASEMFEQLKYFTTGIAKKEPKPPSSKALMEKPGLKVWHRKKENKIVIQMELDTDTNARLTTRLLNLTAEINKCFALNQTSLAPAKR